MKHVTPSARYAMDGLGPLRHVVTQLEGAGDRPLSLDNLAHSYNHMVPADFSRIKRHEGCTNDHAVKRWFIEYAVSELGADIIEVVGGDDDPSYRLKVPLEEIIYRRRRVMPIVARQDQFSGGSDPFSPVNGIFAENLRDRSEADDLDDLIASMREFGWIKTQPAIRDERGVTLVGHRRVKAAAQLGIEPEWLDIELGIGAAGDVERLKIALSSNVAFKPMTPTSRKRIATYLYGDVGWSMEKIGAALQVTTMTVSRDLGSVLTSVKTDRASKRGRKGEGRPRKTEAEKEADKAAKAAEKVASMGMPRRDIVDAVVQWLAAGELPTESEIMAQFAAGRTAVRAAKAAAGIVWAIQQEKEAAVTPVGTIPGLAQRLADLAQPETEPAAQTEPEPEAAQTETELEPAAQTEPEPEPASITEHVHIWVCSCGARMGER